MEGQQAVQTNWELIIEPMESGKKGYALKDGVHWECFRKDSKGKRDSGANNKNLYKKHQKVADCMRYFQRQRQQCFTIWIHDSALCGSGTKSILQSEMPRMWLPTRNKLSTNTIYSVYDKFKFSVEVRTWSVKLTEKLRKKKTPSETIENGPKSNEECVYGFEVLPFFTAQEISMIKDDDSAFRMYLQNVMKSIAIKSGQEWLMYDDLPFSLRTDARVDLLRLWEKMTAPEVVTVNTGHCSDTRLKGKFSRQCTDEEVHKFMRHIETNVYGTKLKTVLAETFDDRATKQDECVVDALLLRIIHESASIVGVGREYYLCQDIAELSHIALKFPEITKVIDDVAKESGNHNTKIATAVLSELGVTVEELVVKDDHVYDALLSIMKNWIVPALVKKSFDRGLSTEVVKKDYEDIMNILFYTRVAKLKDDKDKQDKPSNEEFMEPCNALVSHLIFIEDTKNNDEQAPKKVHVLCETPLEKLKYLFTTDDTGRKYRKPGQKKSKPPKKDENINTGLTKSASVRRRSLGLSTPGSARRDTGGSVLKSRSSTTKRSGGSDGSTRKLSTPGSARRGSFADTGGSVLKSMSSTAKRSGGSDGSTRKLSTPGSARRGSFADTGGSVLKSKSSTAKRSGRSDGSTKKQLTPGSARRGSLADNGGSGNSSVIDTPSGSKRKSINNLARAIDFEEFDYPIVKRKTRASVAKGAAKNAGKCTNKKNTAKKSAASTAKKSAASTAKKSAASTAKSTRLRSKNN